MSTVPAPILDPISESRTQLISIVFLKSSSRSYPYAVSLARNADKYLENGTDGYPVHYAVFGRDKEGASLALTLLGLIEGWQGVQVYTQGVLQPNVKVVTLVLNCYLKALQTYDTAAYCHVAIENPMRGSIGDCMTIEQVLDVSGRMQGEYHTYLSPCRFLSHMILRPGHSASIDDQIQAQAVSSGCHFCPLFDIKAFRKIK